MLFITLPHASDIGTQKERRRRSLLRLSWAQPSNDEDLVCDLSLEHGASDGMSPHCQLGESLSHLAAELKRR